MTDIILRPVGAVRNQIKQSVKYGTVDWREITSEIMVDDSLSKALDGLEEFSHILLLYWMHRSAGPLPLKIHPRGDSQLPLVGLFATRSPHRPNSIGQTVVRLVRRRGNLLEVKGLDAIDGTPVLDIKPYIPEQDEVAGARVPPWISPL